MLLLFMTACVDKDCSMKRNLFFNCYVNQNESNTGKGKRQHNYLATI